MNKMFHLKHLFVFLIFCFAMHISLAQLTVDAGTSRTVCPGTGATIGGSPTATGGSAPYIYSWSPASGLSSTSTPNPIATPTSATSYTVTVTDDGGAIQTDAITITLDNIVFVDAGTDTSICENASAVIGAPNNATLSGITYNWAPVTGLNDPTLPRPTATPAVTTTYTMTATSGSCTPKTDFMTVTIIPTPAIDAGNDVTIKEGESTTLHATGGFYYYWWPNATLTYYFSANPDAEPIVTTTYYVYGTDNSNKCPNYDSVTVFVEPGDDVIFYNTFTPNNDGNNDTWFIGNINKYPNNRLEIFNRYGKLVYKTKGYLNNWDGKSFGEELPAASYFYNMELGDGKGKYHGTVTIIR